jgi:hypothetical protein
MKSEALLIPFAKIKRAETQIHNLKNSIKEFFDRKPYRITSDTDLQVGELVWKFEFTECIPIEFSISIGEILHNLRSPLDQICCELALMNGRTETKVYFPFGGDKKGFETSLREQKKLPSDARDFIKKIEPYSGGAGHVWWALNQLNRRDKHRVGLVPMNTNTVVRMKELKVDGARVIRVGSRRGKHMLCDPATNNLVQPDTTKAPRFRDDDGVKSIEFGPLADNPVYDDMEIMTTFPGARVKIDAEPHFDIAFREIEMDGQPTVAVLNDMRDSVGRILRAFETRFFA